MVDACRIAGTSPASGLLRADPVGRRRSPLAGEQLLSRSQRLGISRRLSLFTAETQRAQRAQADAPSSRRSLRLCGASFVFLAEAEAGFRHPHPQDRSVKTAAVAAGIAADGRTSKTGCRSREIVQAGASPASGLLRADRVGRRRSPLAGEQLLSRSQRLGISRRLSLFTAEMRRAQRGPIGCTLFSASLR
jgi:hypothetical protein